MAGMGIGAANWLKGSGTLLLSCRTNSIPAVVSSSTAVIASRGRLNYFSSSFSLQHPKINNILFSNGVNGRKIGDWGNQVTKLYFNLYCTAPSNVSVQEHDSSEEDEESKLRKIKDAANSLDIRVGRILRAWRHEEADSLYVEEVDVGEAEPRIICSGLVKYVPLDQLQERSVIVLANLKPRNMRGVKSNGMLMAASDASHENVELLEPPEGDAYNTFITIILSQFLILMTKTLAGKVPAIIVFGDSSVDSGNNNQISTVLKSNFEPYGRDFYDKKPTGRFCNGRIPPDFISEAFGLRPFVPAYLDPAYTISDFAQGVCFASAGTGYDNATSDVLNVIPLWKEVEYYKEYQKKLKAYSGKKKANYIINEALYLVSIGTNDFLENYYSMQSTRSSQYTEDQFQEFLLRLVQNFVHQIYHMGARKISLTGLPPMGCLPLERATNYVSGNGDGCNEKYNNVAKHFNVMLDSLVQRLNNELPGIRVVFADAYNLLLQMITKPPSYGFEVSSVACCGTGLFEMGYLCVKLSPLTCTDANKFVFWDAFHVTDKTNHIISDFLMKHVFGQFL